MGSPLASLQYSTTEDKRARVQASAMFNVLDTDGGGTLDIDEANQLISALFPKYDDAQIKTCFETIDTDGSGEVDREEFLVWWEAENKRNTTLQGVSEQVEQLAKQKKQEAPRIEPQAIVEASTAETSVEL